jgi:hypothetical protein
MPLQAFQRYEISYNGELNKMECRMKASVLRAMFLVDAIKNGGGPFHVVNYRWNQMRVMIQLGS